MRKMKGIEEFAEIEEAIDQPIRTYSSGMVVKLAFAIIANIDADILIIDEALAVGDAQFTQKCMRYIRRVKNEKCLLFVSHDEHAVLNLCSTAILLDKGQVIAQGKPKNVIEEYNKMTRKKMMGTKSM